MELMEDARERLIVALDVSGREAALRMVDALESEVRWFKVGMELFYREGADFVRELSGRGHRIFLDLKLHDIPNTVERAVKALAELPVELLTVHAGGGPAMLRAAAAILPRPRLLGVTVLTSMGTDELSQVGVEGEPEAQVERLALLGAKAGLDGLVCSPLEVERLRAALGREVLLVTPGIRATGTPGDDQTRVSTAAEALRKGASLLVVGRPITRAVEPLQATRRLLEEMAGSIRG